MPGFMRHSLLTLTYTKCFTGMSWQQTAWLKKKNIWLKYFVYEKTGFQKGKGSALCFKNKLHLLINQLRLHFKS